jgi:hypothetical protein
MGRKKIQRLRRIEKGDGEEDGERKEMGRK